ncbi:hypothetical protein BASA81_010064 [Batrachochytrium salamandrivorans]|nr:hypothetical protein BASA81_010064 [Batrachochytrium salamandrivorans]
MLSRLLLVVSLLLLFLPSPARSSLPNVCPTDWTLVGGRCMLYSSSMQSTQSAVLACQGSITSPAGENPPRLVDPRTEEENTWVFNQCKDNDGVFPSPWNIWDSSAAAPTPSPVTLGTTLPPFSSVPGTPKAACVCEPPITPGPTTSVWCAPGGSGAWGQGYVASGRCTSGTCGSGSTACQRPVALHPTSAKTGRGACWIGASRKTQDSKGALLYAGTPPEVSQGIVPLNKLSPTFGPTAAVTSLNSQSRYAFTPAYSSSALAPPNCVALWNWDGTGTWTLDYCAKLLPYVCVVNARCTGGYIRSVSFAVADSGVVTQPKCTLCPGGQYRKLNDLQITCTDCPEGYYGDPNTVRSTETCTGVCPAGSWCATGASAPTPCGAGFYGRALVNSGGPGYTSFETGCLACPAGKYCPNAISVLANAVNCNAGTCGYTAQSTASCSQACEAGYYCQAGSACPGTACGSGLLTGYPSGTNAYCPQGSTLPLQVPTGYYGVGDSSTTFRSVSLCPNGFSCNNGVATPCIEGFYSGTSFTPAQRIACQACNNGYYCPTSAVNTLPGSTSPTQVVCAPAGAPYPAEYYCIAGKRYSVTGDTQMTTPVDVAYDIRQGVAPCPADKTYANPADLLTSTSATCRAGSTRNDGIFAIVLGSGRLQLNRYTVNNFDPSTSLDFEVCEPITDVKYKLVVQASARHKTQSIQANLTCTVTVSVSDVNDLPVFSSTLYNRVIGESAAENTQAARCNGVLDTTGCINDATPTADNAVSATDQDAFGQGNLEYSFVGVTTGSVYDKLTINTCTGLISQKGGSANVIRFSDPTIPACGTGFKCLQYTVRAMDDGNGVVANRRYSDTTVRVYILNVNDAPVFTSPSSIEIWIPESTSAGRAPAGTLSLPNTLTYTDDDPSDIVTLYLARNDGSAFEIVNNTIRTTPEGAQFIDFESTKTSYSVDIEARDNGSPIKSAFITVNIKVANLNDPPVIETSPSFYIWENAIAGDPVCRGDEATKCAGGVVDSIHRIAVTDPDNIPTDVLTFSLSKNPQNLFQINSATGQVSIKANNTLDFENTTLAMDAGTGRGYSLEVTVSSSGAGIVTAFPSMLRAETASRTFNVFIVDVNEAPVFTTANVVPFRVVETWPVGVVLDQAVIQAVDPDNADLMLKGIAAPIQTLTFSAVVNAAEPADGEAFFSVTNDPITVGQARIVLKKALDYETAPVCAGSVRCYRLQIQVADSGNPQGITLKTYQFNLIDVNEPPVFTQNSYAVSIPESATYASVVAITSPVPMLANDPDAGGNAQLVYSAIGGDGFAEFGIVQSGNLFTVQKKANVLLDYETKTTYTLRVLVTDNGGLSSSIGKGCTLSQGVSVGCNDGATCINSRCYEICPTYQNPTTLVTVLPANVPRLDVYFCQDMTGVNGMVRLTPAAFRETVEVTVTFTVTDANDAPFIVDRALTIPQPTQLDNVNCMVKVSAQFQAVVLRDQYALRSLTVWDDDKPNPGPNAGPFTFAVVTAADAIWKAVSFNLTNGAVVFPKCSTSSGTYLMCSEYNIGQSWVGLVRVTDRAGLSSTCMLNASLSNSNTAPFFINEEVTTTGVLENVSPAYTEENVLIPIVLRRGFTSAELIEIDPDRQLGDTLTFSASFSTYFSVRSNDSEVTLKQALDYETSQLEGFAKTILISATDGFGASDSYVVTVPVLDVNEAPIWASAPLTNVGVYQLSVPEGQTGTLQDLTLYVTDPDVYAINLSWKTTTISMLQTDPACDLTCLPVEVTPSGVLRIKSGVVLDFEGSRNSWKFGLRVTDGPGLYNDLSAVFSLTDVNEPPVFVGTGSASVAEGSGGSAGKELLDMTQFVSDPDAADPPSSLAFNVTSGNIGSVFEIRLGKLRIVSNQVLDYENIRSYQLGIAVGDSAGHIVNGFVTVTVTNINDVTISSVVLETPATTLACSGQSVNVIVTGTNFGMVTYISGTVVTLSYRRSVVNPATLAPLLSTTSCTFTTSSNTQIKCAIPSGGSGVDFLFNLAITVPTTTIQGDSVSNFATTIKFPAPVVTSVTGANLMSTSGGATVTITGTCLGSTADVLEFGTMVTSDSYVEFCRNVDDVCALLSGCIATKLDGTQITCTNSIPNGLGASVRFRVQTARQIGLAITQGGYAPPTITSTSITSLKTNGEIALPGLVITGTNFGALGSKPSNAYLTYTEVIGGTRSFALIGCTVTTAFTKVTCTSTEPGFGIGLSVFLTFGAQTNTITSHLNFESPIVTGIATAGNIASPSKGGLLVTITGTSFGPVCGNPGVSSTDGAVNCAFLRTTYSRGSLSVTNGLPIVYVPQYCAVVSQTSIVCGTVPGTGENQKWTLIVAGQSAPNTDFVTKYSSPTVGSYENDGAKDASTRGSQIVDIRGNHFGPVGGAPIQVTYGNELFPNEFAAVNCYVYIDHEMIRCLTAVGAGNGLGWKVIVDQQLSRSELSNYGPPVISFVNRSTTSAATGLNADGGQIIYLSGNNFGIPNTRNFLEQVVYGPGSNPSLYDITSRCNVTSHETISCLGMPGSGKNLAWRVTIRGQTSNSPNALSGFDDPVLSNISITHAVTAGAVPIRLVTSNIAFCDPNAKVRVRFGQSYVDVFTIRALPSVVDPLVLATFCQNPSVATSRVRQIDLLVPEMTASDVVDIRVRVESLAYGGGSFQTTSFSFQYDAPQIVEVYAEPGDLGTNIRVTLSGRNFCKSESCCQTYLNGALLTASDIVSHDHSVIVFFASGPGQAYVKCPSATSNTIDFSSRNPYVYGAVRVSDFARLDAAMFDTRGTEDIYVFSLYASNNTVLYVGGRNATNVTIVPFECLNGPLGFVPNTIDGVLTLMTPGQICHRIQGRIPAGQGLLNEVIISVGSLKSKADDFRFEFLRYFAPTITGLSNTFDSQYPTVGSPSTTLTITGTNFGLDMGTIIFGNASFDGTRNQIVCDSNSNGIFWSHTEVRCTVPAGEGAALGIRVLSGSQYSSVTTLGKLKYLAPVITNFQIAGAGLDGGANTEGGQIMTITGTNFGRPYDSLAITTSSGFLPQVKLGVRGTCVVLALTHTTVTCIIPEGDGGGIDLLLRAQNQDPTVVSPIKFSYGAPVIYSLIPATGATNGLNANGTRQVFQVIGKNFGATDTKLLFNTRGGSEIVLGDRRPNDFFNNFIQVSHTSLTVYLPQLVGKDINVTVIATKQSSMGVGPTFAYYPPVITGVTPVGGSVTTSNRRRLEGEGDFVPRIDNVDWSSFGFGNCLNLVNVNNTEIGTSYAYMVQLIVDPTGVYMQSYSFHKLTNYTSATKQACLAENKIGEASRQGQFIDHGELPTLGCVRVFEQTITTTSGDIPSVLFPSGGYGLYIVSDEKNLFMSLPGFDSISALASNSSATDFSFEDVRSAELMHAPISSTMERVPTTGCTSWELISDYQKRLDESTTFAVLPRQCISPVILQVSGSNFGTDCFPMIPDCILYISLLDIARGNVSYEASTTSSEGNHGLLCTSCFRTNLEASFQVPFGAGRNLYLNVTVGGQTEISGPFVTYDAPVVNYLSPGTLSQGNSFQSAIGKENVQVIGENLGYTNTSLSVMFNGVQCGNASWISGRLDRDGRDSLECQTSPDVVGLKSVFLCVGGQASLTTFGGYKADIIALQYGQENKAWNTSGSPNSAFTSNVLSVATSRCPVGYYGRLGEICLPCPEGGLCSPGIGQPIAKPDFFRLSMNSTSERADVLGACKRERIDPSFRQQFPELVQFETCAQVVKCIPADSCLGENKCAVGYEYQLKRCNIVRNQTLDNSCRTWYDGKTGQYRGVNTDCQQHTVPGASCSHDHPEDCSTCVLHFADGASEPTGVCECTVSERCSLCTASEYYRLNGECIACPDNPALVFSLFIIAGLAVILFAYWFQKKKINLAFISIGVDYFQVLAVLSSTNVPWPPMIRAIFQIFSIFLASIDIAAPECLVPNFEFSAKFYMTELMPVLAFVILLIIHTCYSLVKVYRFGKEAKWLSHVSRLVGIFVLILYVLYLSLTKKALDVFNCNPLDPDDGFAYTTFSSLSCDGGGLCRCNEAGGVQESLVAPAIVFLIIYTFGFPLAVFSIVTRYKNEIREDQYLRANQLGDRRETNPRAYDVRKKFQLMYMHFKPKYSFWMLTILGRKFGIAFASLMFRGNPSFQLAVVLIVLFVSFTLQVSIRPYMSPGEYPVVVKELNDNSKKADEDLERYAKDREMYRKVGECMRIQAELMRKEKMHRHKMGAGFWEESKAAAREHDQRSATEKYFFDLNAVESTLLGCLIIISLSGIMFESGRFQSGRPDLEWQGSLVIALVFIVLFGSLAYYVLVLINEVWPHRFARYCGRFFLRYQNEGLSQEDMDRMKDNELKLDANPLFAADGPIGDKSKSLMKEIESSKSALALAKRQNDELKRLKAELEAQGTGSTVSNPLVSTSSNPVFASLTDRLSSGKQ